MNKIQNRYPKGTRRGGQFAPKESSSQEGEVEKLRRKATAVRIRAYKLRKRLEKMDKTTDEYKALAKKHNNLVASYRKMNASLKDKKSKESKKSTGKGANNQVGGNSSAQQSQKVFGDLSSSEQVKVATEIEKKKAYFNKLSRLYPDYSLFDDYEGEVNDIAEYIGVTPDEYTKMAQAVRKEQRAVTKAADKIPFDVFVKVDANDGKEPANLSRWHAKRIINKGYDPNAPLDTIKAVNGLEKKFRKVFTPSSMRSNKKAIGLQNALDAFNYTTGQFANEGSKGYSKQAHLRDEFLDVFDKTGGDLSKILQYSRDWS